MNEYKITYHMFPYSNIVVTMVAKNIEEAIIFAKNYRNDAFSIEEIDKPKRK